MGGSELRWGRYRVAKWREVEKWCEMAGRQGVRNGGKKSGEMAGKNTKQRTEIKRGPRTKKIDDDDRRSMMVVKQ